MKNIIVFMLMIAFVGFSCSKNSSREHDCEHHDQNAKHNCAGEEKCDHAEGEECDHHHCCADHENEESPAAELQLNNGEKWQTDAGTRAAFANMNVAVNNFDGENKNYKKLGDELQSELNTLFKECKMEGEGHDHLHTLLIPIIEDVKTLKNAETPAAEQAYSDIKTQLQKFQQYFQ